MIDELNRRRFLGIVLATSLSGCVGGSGGPRITNEQCEINVGMRQCTVNVENPTDRNITARVTMTTESERFSDSEVEFEMEPNQERQVEIGVNWVAPNYEVTVEEIDSASNEQPESDSGGQTNSEEETDSNSEEQTDSTDVVDRNGILETDFESSDISSVWSGDTDEYSGTDSYLRTDGRASGQVNPIIYKTFDNNIKSIEVGGVANERANYGLDIRIGSQPGVTSKNLQTGNPDVGYQLFIQQGVAFGRDFGDRDENSMVVAENDGGNEHDIVVEISRTSDGGNEFVIRYDGQEVGSFTDDKYQDISTIAIQFDAANQRIDYLNVTS